MTPTPLKELLAKATPGPWTSTNNGFPADDFVNRADGSWVAIVPHEAERQLIARCSPDVMTAVLESLEQARRTIHKVAPTQANGTLGQIDRALALLNGLA